MKAPWAGGVAAGEPLTVDRFDRFAARKRRNRRVGAIAVATAAASTIVVMRAVQPLRRDQPALPPLPGGLIVYGRWNPDVQQADWLTIRPDGTGRQDLGVRATCAEWWPTAAGSSSRTMPR